MCQWNEIIGVKHLGQCLTPTKFSINELWVNLANSWPTE